MQPPPEHDPNAMTQPMSVTPVPPHGDPPKGPPSRGGGGPPPGGRPPPYDHRFGNLPSYLLARLLAFIIDVFGIGFVAAAFVFDAYDRGTILLAPHDASGFATLALVALGVAFGVMFISEALAGTTVGKLIFGLHVRTTRGGHAGIGRAFVRNLLRPLDVLAIGPLLALVMPHHQRVGDLAAGTVVGRSRMPVFSTLLGLVIAGAIAFAQVSFGGGLSSALGVTAAAATFIPQIYHGWRDTGSPLAPFAPGEPLATPTPSPSPMASVLPEPAAPQSPDATASPATFESPNPESSQSEESPQPEGTAAPEASPPDGSSGASSESPENESSPDASATENA